MQIYFTHSKIRKLYLIEEDSDLLSSFKYIILKLKCAIHIRPDLKLDKLNWNNTQNSDVVAIKGLALKWATCM